VGERERVRERERERERAGEREREANESESMKEVNKGVSSFLRLLSNANLSFV
jgi:hypothetical protein